MVIPVISSDWPEVTKLKLYARALYNSENILDDGHSLFRSKTNNSSPKFLISVCIMNLILVISVVILVGIDGRIIHYVELTKNEKIIYPRHLI